MGLIIFSVPGKPQGKKRHETVRTRSGKLRMYTPDKTVVYERFVRDCLKIQLGARNLNYDFPLEYPLEINIVAFFKIPISTSKKKKKGMLEYEILPTVTPDVDNIEKIIYDGLGGFVYKDDKQIVKNPTLKVYGEDPRVVVKLTWGIDCDFGVPRWAMRKE